MSVAGLVVGLGNPGRQYENTRHNMGFMFIDELLRHTGAVSQSGDKFRCELWKGSFPGEPGTWLFAKPQTFMNLSGDCVQPLAAWNRIVPENILVVHDELDLAP
ncbi:MAG: aminoacyl-tRNA hydrolase, partial [Bilophila sp.]